MIPKNKKRIEITLSLDDEQLLESLSSRFNITKSEVIKQAIKIFASKRKHIYKVYIQESNLDVKKNDQVKEDIPDNTPWDEILPD